MEDDLIYYEDKTKELEKRIIIYEKALKTITTRKMSAYLSISDMNRDFIKIANEALNCYEGDHIFYF